MLKIDYKFKDESLLRLAMTHSSYANEHHGTHLQCNERLEFLGDSVLGFVTAGYLFTHYPDLPEGDLTKLRAAVVCEGALDEIAHEIGIPEAIRLGHGEEMGGGRKRASILADATEALLGAIFMDGGIEPARAFVLRFIPHKVEVALAGGAFKDYKTMLQEIVQKNKQETLEYRLAGQSGPCLLYTSIKRGSMYHPFYTSAEKGFDEGGTFRSLGHIRTEFGMAFRLQAWLQSK